MNMRKGIRCMLSLTLVLALIANTLMGGVVSTKAETTATTGGAIDVTTGSQSGILKRMIPYMI